MAQQSACKMLALKCWWHIRILFNCSAWWKRVEFMKNCFKPTYEIEIVKVWNKNTRRKQKQQYLIRFIKNISFGTKEKRHKKTRTTQETCTIIYSYIIKRLAISKSSFFFSRSHVFSLKRKWNSIYMHIVIVATEDSFLEIHRNVGMIRSTIVDNFDFTQTLLLAAMECYKFLANKKSCPQGIPIDFDML